jgi:hypothetical protein
MKVNTIIIDDFLDNPNIVRNSVLNIEFENTGSFPGVRSDSADEQYQKMIDEKLRNILGFKVTYRKDRDCFRFQLCLEGSTTWIHKDDTDWAGVLYLTPNAPIDSGTVIFDSDENIVTVIGNVYNRLVLYRGDLFHRSIVSGFGNSIHNGRLTQVFFFDELI